MTIIYVSRFEKRYNFTQIGNFELVCCFESTVNACSTLFHFSSCFRCRDTLAESTKLRSVRICVVCVLSPIVTLYALRKMVPFLKSAHIW